MRLKCEILSLNKRALCMQKCIPRRILFVACVDHDVFYFIYQKEQHLYISVIYRWIENMKRSWDDHDWHC